MSAAFFMKRPVYLFLLLLSPLLPAQPAKQMPGLTVGERIPSIAAKDQKGTQQTFDSLKGKQGLLLLFSRSADWCPYCKMQLAELEKARKQFEAKGIRVASITYDSPEILKSFADRKSITYPMLSDPQSQIIRAFGILNPEGTGFQSGIPYPGMYYITPDGVIRNRFFEENYTDRFTPNNAYAALFGGEVPAMRSSVIERGQHVTVKIGQSDEVVGPGSRVRLTVIIQPASKVHVYAPGAEANGYKVVKLTLDPNPNFRQITPIYPQGTIMEFPELKESVPVYSQTAMIEQDVVISAAPEFSASLGTGKDADISGNLYYQACDDRQCFSPETRPVNWKLHIEPLDRIRAPEDIRHR